MRWKSLLIVLCVLSLAFVSCAKRNHLHEGVYVTHNEATTIATTQAQAVYSTNMAVDGPRLVEESKRVATEAAEISFQASLAVVQDRITDIHTLESPILFATGSSFLTSESQQKLIRKAEILQKHSDLALLVIGRASRVGKRSVNNELSQRRASVAKRFLNNHGVQTNRLMHTWRGFEDSAGHLLEDQAVRFQVNILKNGEWQPVGTPRTQPVTAQ